MNRYTVIWTYIANYGNYSVMADSPEKAAEHVREGFSADFREKATVYVALADHVTTIRADRDVREAKITAMKHRAAELEEQLRDEGFSADELLKLIADRNAEA